MPDVPERRLRKIKEREKSLKEKYPFIEKFEGGGDEAYHRAFAHHSDEMRRYFEEKLVLGYRTDAEFSDDFRVVMKSAKKARNMLETSAKSGLSDVKHDFARITWLLSRNLYGAFDGMTHDIEAHPSLADGHIRTFQGFVNEYKQFLESLPEKVPESIYDCVARLTVSPRPDELLKQIKRKGLDAYVSLLSNELSGFEEAYKAGDRKGAENSFNRVILFAEKIDESGGSHVKDEVLSYSEKFRSYPTTRVRGFLGGFRNKLLRCIQASYA